MSDNKTLERLHAGQAEAFDALPGREIISRREPCVKHFDLGAGRRQAVAFAAPVHYRAADGTLSDIDNTLDPVEADGRRLYRNRANALRVEFPASTDAGALVCLTQDGHTLSWQLENAAAAVPAQVQDGRQLLRAQLLDRARHVRQQAVQAVKKATAVPAGMTMASRIARQMQRPGLDARALDALAAAEDVQTLATDQLDRALRTNAERRGSVVEKAAEIAYEGILPGISVRYHLEGARLKEDVIASSRAALSSIALRLCDGFAYAVQPDNSVRVLDKESGEALFTFDPPRVYDAAGQEEIAEAVLETCADGARLTYRLSDAFLDNATYPVTIDPVVQAVSNDAAIQDTYLWAREGYRGADFGDVYLMRSGQGEHGESISLVKFTKLPSQSASDTIVNAQLALAPEAYWSEDEYMACYPVKTDWTEHSANWNNMTPENTDHISDEVVSYITSTAYVYCYFDVTRLARTWYKKDADGNSQNFGVAIRYPQGVSGADRYVEWKTAKRTGSPPKLYVNYVSHAGVEGWWQYEALSTGRAGSAQVDLFNGNLVYTHADVAMGGKRMPVSVAHYYNSCLSAANDLACGKGWRTSAHQSLHRETLRNYQGENVNYCVWTDGDGTEHYFALTGAQPYKDEEGMELKLTLSGDEATIKDKADTAMRFPNPGTDGAKTYIASATDACGNAMTYTYVDGQPGRVARVTDGVGRETVFTYANDLLARIDNPDGRYVTFAYDAGERLTSIGYSDLPEAQKTAFAYEGDTPLLTSAQNFDGQKVALTYEPEALFDAAAVDDFAPQARRVLTMEKTGLNDARGAKKRIEYLGMTTRVTAVTGTASEEGKAITYQFNAAGNVVCVSDELGYAQSTKFSATLANTPEQSSKLQRAIVNLATNVDFSADWTAQTGAGADTAARDTGTRCLGMPSVKLAKGAAAETLYWQEAPVAEPGDYTFSAYVKADGLTGGGAFARLKVGETACESIPVTGSTVGSSCGPNAEGWERVQVTAHIAEAGAVRLELACDASAGTAWFACPQLEAGTIAERVNLLTNADFSRTEADGSRTFPADWTKQNGIDSNTLNGIVPHDEAGMPASLRGNALRMRSLPSAGNVAFTQSVPVSGKKGDVFVLGGWVNSRSVAAGHDSSAPKFSYRFYKGTTPEGSLNCDFNREHVGWQFGCWAIAAPCDYVKLEVAVNYSHNAQEAMFSNMFLHREQFGQSFAYDDDKNLVSTTDLAEKKSSMTYDDYDNLLTYVRPGAEAADKYTMTYGDTEEEKKKHLVRTSATPMGMKTSYTYDAYGNAIATVNQKSASDPFIRTEAEYNAPSGTDAEGNALDNGGNYLVKSKDARGNAVTRELNEDYTLKRVTDPTGQAVEYEYDAARRVTGVETTADGKTYKNAYTYENDRIRTVSHNTTDDTATDVTYTFDYDDLGRKTTVKVGAQTLSTNVYKDDRSSLLSEVQYGNGGKVRYAHDDFDRLTGVAYDGDDPETAPRYAYEYGANGAAAVVHDNHLHRTMQTEYDLAERPMQSTLRDEDGNVLYRATLTYDAQNRLQTFHERTGDTYHKTAFTYDRDSRVTQMDYDTDKGKVEYTYDTLGRVSSRKVTGGETAYETAYTFVKGADAYGGNATTPLVASIRQGEGDSAMNFAYEYDSRGNIVQENRNGKVTTYSYDALGQLIRVNDPNDPTAGEGGTTWLYEYDCGGNILSKSYHSYTTGTPGVAHDTILYSYTDNNWKDKLTAYDGQTITYDAIGNPLNDGRRRYEWQAGRQLKKVYVKADLKEGTKPGVDEQSGTVLKIAWSNGNLLNGEVTSTQASAIVTRCGVDVTSEYAASAFAWKRDSGNAEADATWNTAHAGMKTISLSEADLNGDVKIACTLTASDATYGSIAVDGDMDASHTPADLDVNDVFAIENGNLKVTTSRGNVYALEDGKVKAAGAKLNGSITAETKLFASQPEDVVEFAYDHNGLRTQKKVTKADGTVETTEYTLHGKLVTHLTRGSDEMHFFYDAQSRPAMVEFNGAIYSYVHNLQGDIVGILDNAGSLVVEYKYDAWGKPTLVRTLTTAYEALAELNPFRYRGYVYDEETGLYYLRSRYYSPDILRFIKEDDFIFPVGGVLESSLYGYCLNNPIRLVDPTGRFAMLGMEVVQWPSAIPAPAPSISIPAPGMLPPVPIVFESGSDLELGKSIDSTQAHAKGSDSNAGRKIIAKRYRFSTRKRAYEEAKRAGGGREPKFHRDSRGPHFHPSVDNPYSRTPHGASSHDHYYFPERYYEGTFYYETIEIEFITIEEVEDSPINNIDRSYLLIA